MQVSVPRWRSRCSALIRDCTYFFPSGGITSAAAATGALTAMCSGARQIARFQSFCRPVEQTGGGGGDGGTRAQEEEGRGGGSKGGRKTQSKIFLYPLTFDNPRRLLLS